MDGFGSAHGGFAPLAAAVENDSFGVGAEELFLFFVGFEAEHLSGEFDDVEREWWRSFRWRGRGFRFAWKPAAVSESNHDQGFSLWGFKTGGGWGEGEVGKLLCSGELGGGKFFLKSCDRAGR